MTLAGFDAWRSLVHHKQTGLFRDVLETHMTCLDRCIQVMGGWKRGYEDVCNSTEGAQADIHFWYSYTENTNEILCSYLTFNAKTIQAYACTS